MYKCIYILEFMYRYVIYNVFFLQNPVPNLPFAKNLNILNYVLKQLNAYFIITFKGV